MRIHLVAFVALASSVIVTDSHGADQRSSSAAKSRAKRGAAAAAKADRDHVRVRVFDAQGKLVGPVDSPKLILKPSEWRKRLTAEQFLVLRGSDTEAAFCGNLLDNKQAGVYACAGCGLPLFSSEAKFDSGTGWPSFMQPIAKENIESTPDFSDGTPRIGIHCARCQGHLGHVFGDGPAPTGDRYCLNSAALNFTKRTELARLADPAAEQVAEAGASAEPDASQKPVAPRSKLLKPVSDASTLHDAPIDSDDGDSVEDQVAAVEGPQIAVFAGGCFWCLELTFEQLKGVLSVESGYCGGTRESATYAQVHEGTTRHAEAVRVTFDPSVVTYEQLLDVFFDAHDPTQFNRQGNEDIGPQYRSEIFFADASQLAAAEAKIDALKERKVHRRSIVTRLEPLKAFYPAEREHQDFARRNPFDPYVQSHAIPKAYGVQSKHPDLMQRRLPPAR